MIGAFVGSFNPITMGHLMIAQSILNDKIADKIVFVPVSDQYQKDTLDVHAQDRLEMIRLAIQGHPQMVADDMEIEIEKETGHQNKSLETLRLLKEKYQDDVALIMGADNVKELYWWWCADELCKEFSLILINRDGTDIDTIIQEDAWLHEHVHQYYVCNKGAAAISSRMIRKWVQEGKSVRYFTADAVDAYIQEHHLYR